MLQSKRITLRDYREDDWDAVHSYASDAEVVRYMPWGPNSDDETRAFIKLAQESSGAHPRVSFEQAVVLSHTDRPIGGMGLNRYDSQADLGYCFHPSFWGQGFATEAAELILAFGFDILNLHRVFACCDSANTASARVLQKLGMRQEGHLIQDRRLRGKLRDTLLFAVLREEWEQR